MIRWIDREQLNEWCDVWLWIHILIVPAMLPRRHSFNHSSRRIEQRIRERERERHDAKQSLLASFSPFSQFLSSFHLAFLSLPDEIESESLRWPYSFPVPLSLSLALRTIPDEKKKRQHAHLCEERQSIDANRHCRNGIDSGHSHFLDIS